MSLEFPKPLRIVATLGLYRPAIGGTEVQTARLAGEWASRGHHVEVWTHRLSADDPAREQEGGVIVHRMGWTLRLPGLAFVRRATFLITLFLRLMRRRDEYDLVIAQQALLPAVVAALARRRTKKPLAVRLASTGETSDFKSFGALSTWALATLRRETEAVVALNESGVTELRAHGFARGVIHQIANGLEPGPDPPARAAGQAVKVLYVGGFRAEKSVGLLLRAWARSGCPGELRLAGDGPLRTSLENLAKELGINATFLGNLHDPRSILRDSDIFVLPSQAEGMSNALLEAMAEECACLATFVGGNVDCLASAEDSPPARGRILKGEAGWLVASGDESAMADALIALSADYQLRAKMGRAARRRILARHTLGRTAEDYLRVFRAVTS